ncbi:MAG: OadG family protein [Clostridia bacterium]|nr:OadG family protein [Clostridia bacterium]
MSISPWFVLALGMGTVFFGLICLIFISMLMSWMIRKFEKPAVPAESAAQGVAVPTAVLPAGGVAFGDRKLLDAIIAAAIATYDGSNIEGLRIRSIRQIGGSSANRQQFVAAVSAAVATTMGADVQGLRIHSIKKI